MSLSLLHHQPIHSRQHNQPTEDISSIVAQQLAELEKLADTPSEPTTKDAGVVAKRRQSAKAITSRSIYDGDDHNEANLFESRQNMPQELRQAAYHKTTIEIKQHSSRLTGMLQSVFGHGFISVMLEVLSTTVLRPIPLATASLMSFIGSLSALLWLQATGLLPVLPTAVLIFFLAGYFIGLSIDIVKQRTD